MKPAPLVEAVQTVFVDLGDEGARPLQLGFKLHLAVFAVDDEEARQPLAAGEVAALRSATIDP